VIFDKFKPNTRYSIVLSLASGVPNLAFRYTDGTLEYISSSADSWISAADKSVSALIGSWATGSTTLNYENCGIFEGIVTADDFVTYQGITVTVPFDGTVYGGTLDVVKGELTITHGIVKAWELSWSINTTANPCGSYFTATASVPFIPWSNGGKESAKCNIFTPSPTGGQENTPLNSFWWNNLLTGYRAIWDASKTLSVDDFTQMLTSNSVVFCGELATPLAISLTPQQITSLVGENHFLIDGGTLSEIELWRH
jgi:hypothetical protein